MNCEHCKFWKQVATEDRDGREVFSEVNEDTVGECRRHAPHPITYPMSDTIQEDSGYVNFVVWPQVHAGEPGCGEFKKTRQHTSLSNEEITQTIAIRSVRLGKGWVAVKSITET